MPKKNYYAMIAGWYYAAFSTHKAFENSSVRLTQNQLNKNFQRFPMEGLLCRKFFFSVKWLFHWHSFFVEGLLFDQLHMFQNWISSKWIIFLTFLLYSDSSISTRVEQLTTPVGCSHPSIWREDSFDVKPSSKNP